MILHNLDSINSSFNLDTIDKKTLITCPHCKTAQYLAGEIFMPGALIGKPKDVVRDAIGKFIYVDFNEGDAPEMTESFTCEYCSTPFVVEATITYRASAEAPEKDFTTQCVPLLD